MRLFRAVVSFSVISLIFVGQISAERFCDLPISEMAFGYTTARGEASMIGSNDSETGIKEIIPAEFRERYEKWKNELLSTDFGRKQWESYANNKNFLLKIVVKGDRKFGAGTDDYKWDDNGKLIGATITLGRNLDRGYPDPVYYPVMNSLSSFSRPNEVDGNMLASTKLAHEFGHVDSTSLENGDAFQRQEKLMTAYYKIFLDNGYNTKDPRLVQLTAELGRNPIEIWEDREYWGEANAMRFLVNRINKENFYCSVIAHIMRNVSDHAQLYETRFDDVIDSTPGISCRN